ncbi:hypothetical protein [Bombilactobacillus mellis]|uniref:hypothetical protein n=1 Tax=Bombilactobacillus mellis TaxID=1218508 RepID=UPI00158089B3|nr:hypothetical protein [Bombilactobacillus mellis]MBI0108877.1 hypothetical protein [Lactobacillus sp. W8085]NUF25145.1 hypothetical protein [Bombilactobacillus mellis]
MHLQIIISIFLFFIGGGQIIYALNKFKNCIQENNVNIKQLMRLLAWINLVSGIFLLIFGLVILTR